MAYAVYVTRSSGGPRSKKRKVAYYGGFDDYEEAKAFANALLRQGPIGGQGVSIEHDGFPVTVGSAPGLTSKDKPGLINCIASLMERIQRIRAKMTKREEIAYAAGLRAAHMEEALVQGETSRALAHAKKLDELMTLLTK